jgi:hypothetical protein
LRSYFINQVIILFYKKILFQNFSLIKFEIWFRFDFVKKIEFQNSFEIIKKKEKNLEIRILVLAQRPSQPTSSLAQQGRVWVDQTDPAHSPHTLPSHTPLSPEPALANPSHPHLRLAISAGSDELHRHHLG